MVAIFGVVVVGGWSCETEGGLSFVFSFRLTSGQTDNLRLTKFDTRHMGLHNSNHPSD